MANFAGANGYACRNTLRKLSAYDMKHGGLALAAQTLYQGTMVGLDAAAKTVRRGGGLIATFQGGMLGRMLSPSKLPAVVTDVVEWEQGIFCWANIGAITLASKGAICYADDDQSVSLTNTNVIAGVIEDVTAEGVWVLMGPDTRVP